MTFDFTMPDLGEGITEGEIRKWHVSEGDSVEEHQTVLEIETDKAIVEVPSPKKGIVLKINKHEGEIVKVGEVLMSITEHDKPLEKEHNVRSESVSVVGVLPEEEEEILAVPAVRELAKDLGVKLEEIKGSGPGGSITREDVLLAAEQAKSKLSLVSIFEKPVKEELVERIPLRGMRRTIARNLMTAQKSTVSVTGMEEADITELWNLREKEKDPLLKKGVHLTFMPFFIKAAIHALAGHPMLNASIDDEREEIIIKKYYSIGIAIDTPDGLMVPIIRNAEKKTILELAMEIQDLGKRARERKIGLEEMKGGTFTITNYGHFGGTFATPIINYPEVAILGIGKISEKPWVKDGQIVIRKILPLSLTFDHRVTDGVDASLFLSKIVRYLEDPALLFIESA